MGGISTAMPRLACGPVVSPTLLAQALQAMASIVSKSALVCLVWPLCVIMRTSWTPSHVPSPLTYRPARLVHTS